MRLVFISLLLFCVGFCNAQNAILCGNSKSYSGQKLEVFMHKDFISELPQKLGETVVDSEGNFEISFTVDKITRVYIPSGRFIIEYFAYPDLRDTVLLPRFWEKPNDMFFVPRKVWAKNSSLDKNDLNNLIFNFDRDLKGLTGRYTNRFATKDASVLDDIIPFLNNKYKSDNKFFNTYRRYSLAMTEFMVYSNHPTRIIDKYFKNKNIHAGNIAYTDLFKKVFYKHIDFYRFRKRNNLNGSIIYNELNTIIEKQDIETGKLRNYIILYLLKDACHNAPIDQAYVFEALSYLDSASSDSVKKAIAKNILSITTKLAKGYKAPIISGVDIKGNLVSTSDFKNKYLYICFYEAGNPRCINDLKAISNIAKYNTYLQVCFICDISKKPACVNELKNIGMQNNIIFCKDIEEVKKTFQVIVCPEYFLVGKNGKFIKSHTAKPDNQLFKHLNLIRIKEIREGNIKERSIFN